ncbi:MAG TPA: prephenate dehydrogenase, partial [Steroidobacteraceae bacterium]
MAHLIQRAAILGTGLIGGSFAKALRKYTPDIHIAGWDRRDVAVDAGKSGAVHEVFSGPLDAALRGSDLVYIALPIGATLDLLPEIARHAPAHALVTDACSTKFRVTTSAAELFPEQGGPLFLGGHPMAGRELSGFAHADADLFRNTSYALTGPISGERDPRVGAFVKILEKMGARPLWIGAQQHDYAVGLASHLPQLAAVALGSFLYDRLDENGLPITLAGPGLRDSLRLAGSPYSTWRD